MSNQDVFGLILTLINFALIVFAVYLGYKLGYKEGALKGFEMGRIAERHKPEKEPETSETHAQKWLRKGNLLEAIRCLEADGESLLIRYESARKQFNLGLIDFSEHEIILQEIKKDLEGIINKV